jgi:hypothetical protein
MQPATVALVQGRSPAIQAPAAASAPAAIPGVVPQSPSAGSAATVAGMLRVPSALGVSAAAPSSSSTHTSRSPVAGGSSHGSGSAATFGPLDGGGGSLPSGMLTSVPENASSMPSNSKGNGPGAMLSFPYFPLYTLDYDNGIVLFNNEYQQATLAGTTDLYAQVKGTTVSSYSWTASGGLTSSTSGASTYHFQINWEWFNGTGPRTETVTLTVTDTNNHQESQTYYFAVPSSNVVTLPSSASWPVTIPPDLVEAGAPTIASQYVSVDADSGGLNSLIPLPSYNPNIPALALTYNSMAADPRPMVVVHHQLDPSQSVPTKVDATLTFNGSTGTKWVYDTSQFVAGDVQQIALQANATSLSTGRYSYSVQIVDERATNTTLTYSGTATVLNQSTSAFGDGWTLQGLEQIVPATGGVILILGDNGESLWFSGSFGSGGGTYTDPAGEFSTLTLNADGTYTRTLTNGTQITFNSSGYQTATIDLNGLHTTYGTDHGFGSAFDHMKGSAPMSSSMRIN